MAVLYCILYSLACLTRNPYQFVRHQDYVVIKGFEAIYRTYVTITGPHLTQARHSSRSVLSEHSPQGNCAGDKGPMDH